MEARRAGRHSNASRVPRSAEPGSDVGLLAYFPFVLLLCRRRRGGRPVFTKGQFSHRVEQTEKKAKKDK